MGPGGFALLVASTDLRPPRGLPARSPSAPRASLGASARSPARPRRPRGGLQSVGARCLCVARPPTRSPHASLMARLLVAQRVFRAPEAPAAREARASLRSAPRLEAARALRSLRRPPHQWGRVAGVWFGASSRSPARPRRRPPVPRPCPVDQAVRFLETPVAFARSCLCGVETAITFAGENRAVLVRLLVAVVMVVSTVAVQGRAVVMGVSY